MSEIIDEYLKMNPTWHVEDSQWKAKQIQTMLNRHPLQLTTIADVGCGAGEILNQLYAVLPSDVLFCGYDISKTAIGFAKPREKERLKFHHADFLQSKKYYDLLLMIDVFEHVEDYLGFLKSCKNTATYKIFHIPLDISIQAILRNKLIASRISFEHLHYFTRETAIATLEGSGYSILDSFYTKASTDFPKNTIKSKIASWLRRFVFRLNKDFAVKLFGGYSLLVLAK